MTGTKAKPEEIARLILEADTVAVCSHISPDGDTLGCAAAMRLALLKLGKKPSLFCDGKVPDQLDFLPGIGEMREPTGDEGPFDLLLAVDVSDVKRMGTCLALRDCSARTALIDHHPTNPFFMEANWVDGEAPAACVMIFRLLGLLGVVPDRDIAVCLYTGISTDTGNFAFDATNAECFGIMRDLMNTGLPLAKLNRILFRDRAMPQVKLIGKALASLTYYEGGRIAVMKLTKRDFDECGALSEHADTVVNFGLDTVGTEMALLARETLNSDGTVKMSLRSKEPVVISNIAKEFGGGGHPQASGITMEGTLDDMAARVLEAMIKKLNG